MSEKEKTQRMSLTARILNKVWEKNKIRDDKRLAEQSFPEGVCEVRDIAYIDDGDRDHMLDVYYTGDLSEKMPVLIDVHGGGWTYGDKELNTIYAMNLTAGGYKVVNISYRLLFKTDLAGMICDCIDACNWVYDNAEEYAFDLDNVFITGDSAGGHLAVTLAAVSESRRAQEILQKSMKLTFNAVASCCGALDMNRYNGLPLVRGFFKMMYGERPADNPARIFNAPDTCIEDGKLPPVFMSTCDKDFVKGQTFAFKKYCEQNGIEHEYYYTEQTADGNKLMHVYDVLYPMWDESVKVTGSMFRFFDKHKK